MGKGPKEGQKGLEAKIAGLYREEQLGKDSQAHFPGLEKLSVGGKVLAVLRKTVARQRAASPFDMLIVLHLVIRPGIET